MSKKKKTSKGKDMALTGHLKELRNRILICVACLIVAFLACLAYASRIVELLTDIGATYGYQYVFIAPQELLMQYFSVALIGSLCVALPMILYQLWAFVRPGLEKRENLFFVLAMLFGLAFFAVGVYFAYRIMLPFMLEFLIGVNAGTSITATISVQNYISFLLTIFLIFGAVFELPVLSVLLTQLGLVKVSWMKKARRVVIVIMFFLAAVITPPDVVSQVMVAFPMIGLYELSILICSVLMKLKKRKKKDEDEEDDEEEDDDEA